MLGVAPASSCPLARCQVAQQLTARGRARSTASFFKLCPEASFNIQQTFDRLTCDGHTECQTTAKMSSHGGENSTLCLGHRGTLGQCSPVERKGDIHQYFARPMLKLEVVDQKRLLYRLKYTYVVGNSA